MNQGGVLAFGITYKGFNIEFSTGTRRLKRLPTNVTAFQGVGRGVGSRRGSRGSWKKVASGAWTQFD